MISTTLTNWAERFSEGRSIGLTVFRVAVAAIVLRNAFSYYPVASDLFGLYGVSPYTNYLASMSGANFDWALYPFHISGAPEVFIFAMGVLAFLFLLGIGKRVTGFSLIIMLTILRIRNPYILDGSDNVIQVTLPFLVFAACYQHFSYDLPSFDGWKRLKERVYALPATKVFLALLVVAIMMQICYVYLFTSIAKWQGELWQNGTAIYYTMRVDEFRATEWNIPLTRNHYFVVLGTYSTLIIEMALPFLAWFKRTRWAVLLAATGLHLGIWYFMRIDNFSWVMIASYAVFFTNAEYRLVQSWAERALAWIDDRLRPVWNTLAPEPLVLSPAASASAVPSTMTSDRAPSTPDSSRKEIPEDETSSPTDPGATASATAPDTMSGMGDGAATAQGDQVPSPASVGDDDTSPPDKDETFGEEAASASPSDR